MAKEALNTSQSQLQEHTLPQKKSSMATASPKQQQRRNLRDFLSRGLSGRKQEWKESSRTVNTAAESTSSGRRRVTFAPTVATEVATIPPLTDEEKEEYHYTGKDVSNFEKDSALTVLMYVKRKEVGIPWEEKQYTLRGLEELVRRSTQRLPSEPVRAQHSAKVLSKVKVGTDEERLAEAARASSKEERQRALARAKQDALYVQATRSPRSGGMRKMIKKLSRRKL